MLTHLEKRTVPQAILDIVKTTPNPNDVLTLDLGFKDIHDYTFLPNYKNLVCSDDQTNIDISGNGLVEVPEEVFKMKALRTLNLSFNLISVWDDVPIQVEVLNLSSNKISDINSYVTQMTKLTSLDLSSNIIPSIIPINRVQSLRYLFLSKNKVSPDEQILFIRELAKLKNIIELDLECNLIEDTDEIVPFRDNKTLLVLNLANNPVVE